MRALALLVLSVALLAGCASAPTATPPKTDDALAPASASTAQAGAANATGNVTEVVLAPPVLVTYKGSSPTGVCAFTPVDGQCQFADPGAESWHVIPYKGTAKHASIHIAYEGVQPGAAFYAAVCMSKDADPNHAVCDYKTGPSPLVLEQDLAALPPGAAVAISAGSVTASPDAPAGAYAFSSATFEVKGALTMAPAEQK